MHTRNNFSIFSLILEASARLISTMMRQLDTVLILVTITALLRGGAPQEEANCFLCESLAGGEKKIPEISTVLLFNTVGQNCIHISANSGMWWWLHKFGILKDRNAKKIMLPCLCSLQSNFLQS